MLAFRRIASLSRAAVALLACGLAALLPLALPMGAHAASGDLSWYYADDSPTGAIDGVDAAARGPGGSMHASIHWGDDWTIGGDLGMIRFRPQADPPGPVLWQRAYDDPDYHMNDSPGAIAVDAAGSVIAGGQTQTTPEAIDWVVVKWLANGTQAWVSTFAGQAHKDDWLDDVACDKAGNVYACGQIDVGSGNYDWLVTKYRASDGKLLWKYVYSGPKGSARADWAHALVVGASDNLYVTGSSETPNGNKDLVVMRLSPKGKASWIHRVDGTAHATDYGSDIALHEGSVYVVGQSWSAGGTNRVMLARYGSSGRRAWLRTWRSSLGSATRVRGFALDGAGNAVVAGAVAGGAPDPMAFLVSWTSGGRLRWARTYWRKATGEQAVYNALAVDGRGRIWTAGSVGDSSASTVDALLTRYQPSGKRLWLRTFDGGDHMDDWFSTLVLWGGKSLFAGGTTSTLSGGADLLAAKYVR